MLSCAPVGRRHVQAQRGLRGGGGRRRRYVAQLRHPGQHDVPAARRISRVRLRVVQAGVVHHSGEQRRLGDVQLAGVLPEVILGGRLDTVDRIVPGAGSAEPHRVQVIAENLFLGAVLRDPDRVFQLDYLALQARCAGRVIGAPRGGVRGPGRALRPRRRGIADLALGRRHALGGVVLQHVLDILLDQGGCALDPGAVPVVHEGAQGPFQV
jgi:hypothetical protein